jgi:hypothetical protein
VRASAAIGAAGMAVGLALGCAGPQALPEPAAQPAPVAAHAADWIEAAVDRALEGEVMPGTTEEPDPAREPLVRAFFEAHGEYSDPKRLEELLSLGCLGVEDAHERLRAPPPKDPLVVEVTAEDWKVVVGHAETPCTSDDWSWFNNDIREAVEARQIVYAYGGASNGEVVVRNAAAEKLKSHPLEGQGYLLLSSAHPPREFGHDLPTAVIEGAFAHFGMAEPSP